MLAVFFALATAPAFAFCPSLPDDASTHFVDNQQALMLCQQQELTEIAAAKAREAKFQADLQALQIQFEQELRLQQALAVNIPAL
jgi:hypothetical protein